MKKEGIFSWLPRGPRSRLEVPFVLFVCYSGEEGFDLRTLSPFVRVTTALAARRKCSHELRTKILRRSVHIAAGIVYANARSSARAVCHVEPADDFWPFGAFRPLNGL